MFDVVVLASAGDERPYLRGVGHHVRKGRKDETVQRVHDLGNVRLAPYATASLPF